jgi:hypothetical protein
LEVIFLWISFFLYLFFFPLHSIFEVLSGHVLIVFPKERKILMEAQPLIKALIRWLIREHSGMGVVLARIGACRPNLG